MAAKYLTIDQILDIEHRARVRNNSSGTIYADAIIEQRAAKEGYAAMGAALAAVRHITRQRVLYLHDYQEALDYLALWSSEN